MDRWEKALYLNETGRAILIRAWGEQLSGKPEFSYISGFE
jgi:hypothetical protein